MENKCCKNCNDECLIPVTELKSICICQCHTSPKEEVKHENWCAKKLAVNDKAPWKDKCNCSPKVSECCKNCKGFCTGNEDGIADCFCHHSWVKDFEDFYWERNKYKGRKLGIDNYKDFISSLLSSTEKRVAMETKISLIKMIVEIIKLEKEEVPSKDDDSIYPIVVEEINKKLDTISSKLKELIK